MKLKIGTDCSGIEAPIQALQQLGIPFEHKWSCEIDKFARQSIEANYTPEIIFTDITQRDHTQLPDIDLYVCGFPCQPFSLMGLKRGTDDPRSNIMIQCIQTIRSKLPNLFILENVKNFKFIQNGEPFNYLIDELNKFGCYNIYHDLLNTKNYGIPQNRERIFIIGIKKEIQLEEYRTPAKLQMKPLDEFIIDKTIHDNGRVISDSHNNNLKKIIGNKQNYVVTPFTYYFPIKNISPTLITNCSCYYLTTYKRCLTSKECLLLQGFSPNFNQTVSNKQIYRQAGNSMSVCVVKELIKKLVTITLYNDL